MSRLVVSLVLVCAVPAVVGAQERRVETRAATVGYQFIFSGEGGGLHGGFATLVLNASGRLAGVVQVYGAYEPKSFVSVSSGDTFRVDGGQTVVLATAGLRLQGHYGRLVPHVQVLIGGGVSRIDTTTTRTSAGSGTETYRNRHTGGGFLTQAGVGLTIGMSDRAGLTTTLEVVPSFPNPFRGIYGIVSAVGVTITF